MNCVDGMYGVSAIDGLPRFGIDSGKGSANKVQPLYKVTEILVLSATLASDSKLSPVFSTLSGSRFLSQGPKDEFADITESNT